MRWRAATSLRLGAHLASIVKGAQIVELLEGTYNRLAGGWRDELEREEIIDTERLPRVIGTE